MQVVEEDWRWWSQDSVFVQQNPYQVGQPLMPHAQLSGCSTSDLLAMSVRVNNVHVLPCTLQDVTPAPNSVIDMLLRATNKETGQGLKEVQIAAQCNTLIAGKPGTGLGQVPVKLLCSPGQHASWCLLGFPCLALSFCCGTACLLAGRCSRLRDVCQCTGFCHILPGDTF